MSRLARLSDFKPCGARKVDIEPAEVDEIDGVDVAENRKSSFGEIIK